MNLSLQTVFLVFGVTLAHLFLIALLAPRGETVSVPEPRTALAQIAMPDFLEDPLDATEDDAESGEEASAVLAGETDPLDPPALRRDASFHGPSVSDPVVDASTPEDEQLRPRPFSPVPRS